MDQKFTFHYLAIILLGCGIVLADFIGERVNNERYTVAVRAEVQNRLAETCARLEGNLNGNISLAKGLVSVIHLDPHLTQVQFEQAAQPLFQGQAGLRNIGAAPDMVIRLMYPLKGNEKAIGLNYLKIASQSEAAQRARDTRQIVLAGPVQLVQGGLGLVARLPVFIQGSGGHEHFWGLVSAVINVEDLFRKSGLMDDKLPIEFSIRGTDGRGAEGGVFFGRLELFSGNPVLANIPLPYGSWQIAAVPRGGWPVQADNVWQLRLSFLMLMFLLSGAFLVLIRALRAASLAQARAEAAKVQLSATLENTPNVAIQWYDETGKVLYWNLASAKLFGWSSIEAIGKTLADLICTPEAAANFLKTLNTISETGQPIGPYESQFRNRNGRTGWVLSTTFGIPIEGGRLCFVCMDVDITERKAAEDKLRKFSTVIEQSPASIVITDLDGTIEYVNPGFVTATGYERDEAIGCNPRILKSELTPIETFREMWQSLTSGKVWHGELVNKRKNGEPFWEDAYLSPVKNAAGVTTHYVAVKTEITKRKRAEEALRQNESRFRYMLKTSPIAVRIASSLGRKVLFANQRYAELIDLQPEQVIGADPKGYYSNPQDYEDVLLHLSQGENVTNKLVELIIPGGKLKWALASYLNVEYENESAVLGWFYDITERRQAEMALQQSEATSRALINATAETAMLVDENGTLIAINEVGRTSFAKRTG